MELVQIKTDLAFRAVFGREDKGCKEALKQLLQAIIGIKIESITYTNPLNIQEYVGDKKSEMDIEVVTQDGDRIDIEIQLRDQPNFKERMVYYCSKLLHETIGSGDEYTKLKKSIVISIMDFTLFHQNEKKMNRFRYLETQDYFELTDLTEIIFLEMDKVKDDEVIEHMNEMEKWLYFLKFAGIKEKEDKLNLIAKESEGIKVAYELLNQVSADDMMRAKIRIREKAERDYIAQLTYAKEEGREEGVQNSKRETAYKGIELGLDIETICNLTGLTKEEVNEIKSNQL